MIYSAIFLFKQIRPRLLMKSYDVCMPFHMRKQSLSERISVKGLLGDPEIFDNNKTI